MLLNSPKLERTPPLVFAEADIQCAYIDMRLRCLAGHERVCTCQGNPSTVVAKS